jgi:tRNA nucleotidyltransferase (CCA-adding enzyme)
MPELEQKESSEELTEMFISHSHLLLFAEERVNLGRDDVKEYREQVNRLRNKLSDYINEHPDYVLIKMLHSGSVKKGTALKTVNDMDVAVYVKPSDESTDERRLIKWLKDRLREVYPTMKESQFTLQDHCVTVSFEGSGLDVDVVPVIYEGDHDDKGFLIVKDTGERVLTSIPLHLEFIQKRKRDQPNHFAQIVRFMKWWARQRKLEDDSFRLKSFMLELLCAHLADGGLDMSDYPRALERVFAYIASSGLKNRIFFSDNYRETSLPSESRDAIKIYDPVNPANNVAGRYSDGDRVRIVEAAKDALDALTEARYATTKGRAVAMWQVVFGSTFRG